MKLLSHVKTFFSIVGRLILYVVTALTLIFWILFFVVAVRMGIEGDIDQQSRIDAAAYDMWDDDEEDVDEMFFEDMPVRRSHFYCPCCGATNGIGKAKVTIE